MGSESCPDCGDCGVKIGADGYEDCARLRSCWADDPEPKQSALISDGAWETAVFRFLEGRGTELLIWRRSHYWREVYGPGLESEGMGV